MKKVILFLINIVALFFAAIIWTLATAVLIEGWKKCIDKSDYLQMLLLTTFYLAMSFKMADKLAIMLGLIPAEKNQVTPKSKKNETSN